MVVKVRWLFSFCFSFTDFQLEHVSKAFHITEDWLVRFGLIFRREDEAGRHFYFKDYSEYDPWLILCNGGTVSIVEEHCCYDYNVLKSGIKYVHKLQNIIYELDDIELDVNNSLHEK